MTKEELKKHLSDNYHHTAERVFKNKFQKEYFKIQNIDFPSDFIFQQKLYHYMNDDIELKLGMCPVCGNRCKFITYKYGYHKHCSYKCSGMDDNTKSCRSETNMILYGVKNISQNKEIKEKIKNTFYIKYGVKNPSQINYVKEKKKHTTQLHFNVDNPSQAECIKRKKEKTCMTNHGVKYSFQSKIIREKSKETNNKKLGVDWPMQSKIVLEKSKATHNKKRNVDWPMQCNEVKEKSKQTCLEKYGVEYTSQAEITKTHIKQTNLERYGVPYNCMRKEARIGHGSDSKPNLDFAAKLDSLNIAYEREFALSKYVYDFKIGDILVEIDPTITHNSSVNIFGGEPKPNDYHLKKSQVARNNGYECIHVWDWDDVDRIVNYLSSIVKDKIVLDFSGCEIREVSEQDAVDFVYKNSLFPIVENCNSIGLFHNGSLVQLISYEIGENISIVSLCSCSEYVVSCGYSGLIEYISNIYDKDIYLTIDLSKDSGKEYTESFNEIYCFGPVVNQCGFGDDSHMVYDCGYKIFGYKY